MSQNQSKPRPIVPWIGGKRRLAKHLFPLFPEHKCYVEPFCGAAAIFFMKEPSKAEVINDINGDLVNLYRVVKHHLEELYKQFKWLLVSRENFHLLQQTPPEVLTDIQRAARFLYLQKLAFGGKVDRQTFGTATLARPRFNLLTIENDLAEAHLRLSQTTIEHLPWLECSQRYDREHTLFYLDPPYWDTVGYGVEFGWNEYEKILEFMQSSKGKVVLSINDHPAVMELFKDMRRVDVDHTYTVGGNNKQKKVTELIYCNW